MLSVVRRLLGAVLACLLVVLTAGTAAASSGSGSGGGNNVPPFDFTDAFYRSNGVNPGELAGRPTGTGASVIATPPDTDHRNVRVKFTLPGYDTSGNHWYFSVLGDLTPNAFTADAAGARAKQLAESSPVYVFPTRTGDPLGVGNNRQADMIDLSNGYFSNNPLGLWVHVFVTWTPAAFSSSGGQKALADLQKRNGLALDGTPVIASKSQLDSLAKAGYVALTKRPETATGRYFVCPVIKDPRRGGIAADAFLISVRRPDGTPLPTEQTFVTDFEALRTTGDYPR